METAGPAPSEGNLKVSGGRCRAFRDAHYFLTSENGIAVANPYNHNEENACFGGPGSVT
jgi:hypothetical protein